MQNVPRKAPHNPADPLAMSYLVQLIGAARPAVSRSRGSLHRDSTTGRDGDGDGGDADTTEHGGTGYFAQLQGQIPEKMTWRRLLSFCIPGEYLTPNNTDLCIYACFSAI